MIRTSILVTLFAHLCCAAAQLPLPTLAPARLDSLEAWLDTQARPPEEAILALFDTCSVVLVGEYHRIRHDEQLVQELLRQLPAAGVDVFAWEFARREDQPLLDSLLALPTFDEPLAREVLFRGFVFWGYRDYLDILRAAWETRHTQPEGQSPLRVLGLGDSPDWSVMRKPGDFEVDSLRCLVWRGGGERQWAGAVLAQAQAGHKVLAHCGIHHAFSRFAQPIVRDGHFVRGEDDRFGQHLWRELGPRVATVYLHAPWPGLSGYEAEEVRPVEGVLDAMLLRRDPARRRLAFSTHGTPLGRLPARDSCYSLGLPAFTLEDFCDLYVLQGLFDDYEGVAVLPDFVHRGNVERARLGMPNPECRSWSAGKVMRAIREDADMRKRLKALHVR